MLKRVAIAALTACVATPALASDEVFFSDMVIESGQTRQKIGAFFLADHRIEMVAVTRNARADTELRRARLDESRTMRKVMPGYPQPAVISVDFRVAF